MKPFGPFALTQDQSQDVTLDLTPVVDVLVVKNASPFMLEIQSYQGGTHKILPFWADLIAAPDFQGTLTVLPTAGLSSASPPMQSLLVDAYGRGERVLGSYPAPLAYQFNLGNNVPLNAQATSVANDGNASGTQFIEASVGGIVHVLVFNDGLLGLKKDATSADQELLDYFDLATGGHFWGTFLKTGATHALYWKDETSGNIALLLLASGGIQTDNGAITTDGSGHVTSTAASGAGANKLFAFAPSDDASLKVSWRGNGNELALIDDSTGLRIFSAFMTQGGLKVSGLGNKVRAWSFFSGTGSGTFSHGLGTTPNVVLAMQSVAGSQTMGWNSPTATQVNIVAGGGNAWVALALLMA